VRIPIFIDHVRFYAFDVCLEASYTEMRVVLNELFYGPLKDAIIGPLLLYLLYTLFLLQSLGRKGSVTAFPHIPTEKTLLAGKR